MSFKQRVGNFCLLAGGIGLLIFAASVIVPSGQYDIPAFLAGALLFGLGLNFRMSKAAAKPHAESHSAAPAHKAAAKGGPPKPGGAPGGGGGPPKRQGLLAGILKGPRPRKTAPAPPRPGGGGGGPPRKK